MIYLNGLISSIATANANPPAPVPGWIDDVLAQTSLVAGSTPEFETGMNFTVPSPKTCTGVRAYWSNGGAGPWTITLTLYVGVGGLVAQETIVVPASNAYIQTTGLFGSHTLNSGFSYTVTLSSSGVYAGYGNTNPFTLPKSYTDYSVQVPYLYNIGAGFPGTPNFGVCALVEPVF